MVPPLLLPVAAADGPDLSDDPEMELLVGVAGADALVVTRAMTASTIAEVFDHVAVLLGPGAAAGRLGNSVIVASNTPFDPTLLDADGGRLVDDLGTQGKWKNIAKRELADIIPPDALADFLGVGTLLGLQEP